MHTIIDFEKKCLIFEDPKEIISCHRTADVPGCFGEMEKAVSSGYYLSGFLSYEAGYAFEQCLDDKKDHDFPLVHMGVYDKKSVKLLPKRKIRPDSLEQKITDHKVNVKMQDYFSNINAIRDYIASGDVYQITYCIKLKFDYSADPFKLYDRLLHDQPVPYPAYLQAKDFTILSLSPELFIKKDKDRVTTKPMKGTWPRGRNRLSDIIAGKRLHFDPKNRAENVMIADLLRNDLGRIGREVRTPKLFEVAGYTTLFQMTSTVTAEVDKDISLFELFKAIHPSGSVTGAPKIRAMEVIREIEKEERKIYTGAIGYITPQKDLFFNVPIRTILLKNKKGEMGVGGGIVWDSTPKGEWDECMLKASFITQQKNN
ncbi:MAG: aminodeoxychorismate synthase component I [Candidatus Saganbacteria bacterium]|nr:aminodeoxychorismate synthase component I [Candidatus Saganbacteria bacterium]